MTNGEELAALKTWKVQDVLDISDRALEAAQVRAMGASFENVTTFVL